MVTNLDQTAPMVGIASPSRPALADQLKDGNVLTGAEVFAALCKDENLGALFCAPGNYAITHAIAAAGIPSFGGRTEGGMCSAADGFYRASGEIAACSGTEGPGFSHMIMGIAAAKAARTPLLILASNFNTSFDERESDIQDMQQQSVTEALRKYGKRITVPNRLYEYAACGFRHLKCGVPGPVHLDFTEEVCSARFTDPEQLIDFYDRQFYRSERVPSPHPDDILDTVRHIERAERPLIIAGHGLFHRHAAAALLEVAERSDIGVVVTGPNRGHFPDDHRLSMNLSPKALGRADLVIFIGQYCMPSHRDYPLNRHAASIRVNPVAEELGRTWPLNVGIVSDEFHFLRMLLEALPPRRRPCWVNEISAARVSYEEELNSQYVAGLSYSQGGFVHPAVIGKEIYDFFFAGDIDPKETVTGWSGYTAQRFIPPRLRAYRPGQSIVTMYQFGALGTAIPMMLGACVAVKEGAGVQRQYRGAPTLVQCGDSEMGYSMLELATAAKYRLPLISVVYNNNAWGTWADASSLPNALHLHLHAESTRYDIMAEQLGVHGEYVREPNELRPALQRSYDIAAKESRPALINVQARKEFTSSVAYPPGQGQVIEPGIASYQH